MGRRLWFVVASIAAAGACSTFDAGPEPATVPEAGAPADATPVDATAEASVDAGPFCSGVTDASFCWSFDEKTNALLGPKLALDPSNTLDPTLTDASASPPNAMLAASAAGGKSTLVVGVPGTSRIRCETAIFIDTHGQDGVDVLLFVTTVSGLPNLSLRLYDNGTTESVRAQAGIDLNLKDVGNVPVGQWTRVALEYLDEPSKVTASVTIEGVSGSLERPAGDGGLPALNGVALSLGLTFAGSGWQVRFDDAFCRSE